MCSDLVRHQNVHLLNPNINYIRTENCKYCKLEKRMNYRNRYRNNPRYLNENYELFYNPELYAYDSTFYNTEQPESREKSTTLKMINRSTCLELSKKDEFCSICQDTIPKNSIIRKIKCGHVFHHYCCDTWLETQDNCPTCRFKL